MTSLSAQDVIALNHGNHANSGSGSLFGVPRKFTWKELSRLNEPHNAHIAYRGKVYDVSLFMRKHPGGVDQILCAAGRDITQVFESYHNTEVANVLDKYYVGELVDNEFPVFPEMGQFYRTLKERVNKHLKDNNLDRKVELWSLFKNFWITFIVLSTWYLAVVSYSFLPLALVSAIICGLFTSAFFLTMQHDANHCAITHKPWVWTALQLLSECVLGISSYCWKHQHNLGHHPYTNMDMDPDLPTSDKLPSLWRIKKSQKWKKFYVYQHLYMPFVYSLMSTKFRIEDFMYLYQSRRTLIRMNPLTTTQWMMFWIGKITHCIFKYVLPYFYTPFWHLVMVNIVSDVAFSLLLGNLNESHHLSSAVVQPPTPDKNNVVNMDWAEVQVLTTCDYCTDSWFWYIMSGGLNHQTAHHLFPDMAQGHYLWVTPLLVKTCKEFGIRYNCMSSFWEAWKKHIEYLKNMGKDVGSKKIG